MPGLPQRPDASRVISPSRSAPRAEELLSHTLFQHALVRQQKQADRFDESFGLVLIYLGPQDDLSTAWLRIVEALRDAARSTDIIGWFEENLVLGLLRARVDLEPQETSSSLQTAFRWELTRRLPPDSKLAYFVDAEVYSPGPGPARPSIGEARDFKHMARNVARHAAKRALDIAGSAALLVVSSPLLLAVGALVKLTSAGPVLFRQERVGEYAKPFTMLKFRTMQVNAGHDIHQQFVAQYIQG